VNGVEGLEMHDEARHWVVNLINLTAYVFHLYDVPMSTGASAGGYQPVRVELWDVKDNVMAKVWLFGLMNAFDMSTATSWASFNKPSECYQFGEALNATGQTVAATSHPAGPGAGVIPLEQWLSTNEPHRLSQAQATSGGRLSVLRR